MTQSLDPELLHILQHALGLDRYGQGTFYRNRFVTDDDSDDGKRCHALIELGYVEIRRAAVAITDMTCFAVTSKGRDAVKLHSPQPPRLTRSQQRYRRYLAADAGLSFGEWLRRGHDDRTYL